MQVHARNALLLVAHAWAAQGQGARSLTLLTALARLHAQDAPVLRALAAVQLAQDQPDAALATLDGLALAGAVDAAFHLLRAEALNALGRAQPAKAAMLAAIALIQLPKEAA